MPTKVNGTAIITKLTNNILKYISTNSCNLGTNKNALLKLNNKQRDNKLKEDADKKLKIFAKDTCLYKYVIQLGMTFVREKREDGIYFVNYLDETHEKKFKDWLDYYEGEDFNKKDNVPVKINELLCKHTDYWRHHSFPMIIVYKDCIPSFINKDNIGDFIREEMAKYYNSLFEERADKAAIGILHDAFKKETYSQFKIFFTSNFEKLRAQTFIKFRNEFSELCNLDNTLELNSFIKLCFLVDIVIGSFVKDFENLIYHHEYYHEILSHGTRAAMTAIMSRNLSHNIGSHVISYWNNRLEDQLKRNQRELKKELINLKDTDELPGLYTNEQKIIKSSKELFLYIQQRMDFVAELSTSIPCSEMSMDIKKEIVTPFKKPNDFKYGEQYPEISPLLSYIAHSDGIDLHKRIKFEICNTTINRRVSIPNGVIGIHAVYSILENFIRNAAKYYKRTDSPLLCDYDIVKEDDIRMLQSKYSKINDAKNNDDSILTKLNMHINDPECVISIEEINGQDNFSGDIRNEISILISEFAERETSSERKKEINRELLELIFPGCIFDTIIKIEIDEKAEFKQDFLVMRLWDLRENSCDNKVINDLRKYLPGQPSGQFSKDGGLVQGGWGIKEMVTCANFLRKSTPDELYNRLSHQDGKLKEDEPPLFRILCDSKSVCTEDLGCSSGEHSDYKGKLGIEFYLRKPRDLAIVKDVPSDEDRRIGEKFGIYEINLEKYENKEIEHRMLLVNEGEHNEANKPCRIRRKSVVSGVNDYDYLLLYKEFIKEELNNNRELPKLAVFGKCFIGHDHVDNDSDDKKIKRIATNLNFVYHLPDPQCTKFTTINEGKGCFNDNFNKSCYIQPISAGYSTNTKLFEKLPDDPLILNHFILELIESALTNVVIVDERISDWAKRDYALQKTNNDILKKMRVFIPDLKCEDVKFDDLEKKINETIQDKEKYEFFVIHQGVLDKLRKENNNDTKLMSVVKDKFKWLVIDSGRGVPENLDKYKVYNVRFVEISALQMLLDNFDKHGLVQTLFSTRRPRPPKSTEGDGSE